jgi:hypothetical protein
MTAPATNVSSQPVITSLFLVGVLSHTLASQLRIHALPVINLRQHSTICVFDLIENTAKAQRTVFSATLTDKAVPTSLNLPNKRSDFIVGEGRIHLACAVRLINGRSFQLMLLEAIVIVGYSRN